MYFPKKIIHSVWSLGWTAFLLIALGAAPRAQADLTLAQEGQTAYRIVVAAEASETERFASEELTNFLQRVTGAVFPVVVESDAATAEGSAIYLGWTAFARGQGIDPDALGEEEWVLRTVGDNLILTGGRPRGTLYAVYEFLEEEVGCHWLDRRTEVVPERSTLVVKPLDVQAKPHFWERQIGNPLGSPEDHWLFLVRNKNYRYDQPQNFGKLGERFPKDAFYSLYGSPGKTHTFSLYLNAKDWFETHPEYFSLVGGKRLPAIDGSGPGQLCLTHPDVRRIALEKLRTFVAQDRVAAAAAGLPPPRMYHIMQNDKYDTHCQCDTCRVIVEREGSESGPMVEFMNVLGAAIEPEYPEITLVTLAYNLTQPPPKTVRPRSNVLIAWCDVYSRCDHLRPLTHPWNVRHYDEIRRWGEIAPRLGIGDDYWTTFGYYDMFPMPWTMAYGIAADLKLFAEAGCETYACEAAYYLVPGKNFIDLEYWLAFQLLVDPFQPVEPLIDTFIKGYYGPAAPAMHSYLTYLTARTDADAQYMYYRNAPHQLAYLDLDFFLTAERLLDEAQARVESGSLPAVHVLRDRFVVDGALLYLWPWLERKLLPSETLPFDKEAVLQRYTEGWANYEKHWYNRYYTRGDPNSLNEDGKRRERLITLFRDPPLPEAFRDLPRSDVADFNALTFSDISPRQKLVPDSDAVCGLVAESTGISAIMAAEEGASVEGEAPDKAPTRTLTFGATGGPTVTLSPTEIPQDGKYHLYSLGRVQVKPTMHPKPGSGAMAVPGTVIWALEGRKLGVCIDRVYDPEAEGPDANVWNAYISLKVDGPVYVRGSTATNGVWLERVLLIRPQLDEALSEDALRLREEAAAHAARRPQIKVPRLAAEAGGDPERVAWGQAAVSGPWSTLTGDKATHAIESRFVRDTTHLYLELRDPIAPSELIDDAGIFAGDDWELLVSTQRGGAPYRQLALNPSGKFVGIAYGDAAPNWDSGATAKSNVGPDGWTMRLALPLDRLVPGGAAPGQTLFVNLMRNGPKQTPLVWSPTYSTAFQVLEQLGEVNLN